MILIAIPFLGMRLGSADAGSDPANTTTRKAYDLLAKGFGPGYNGPLQLVAQVQSPAAAGRVHPSPTTRWRPRPASSGRRRRASFPASTAIRESRWPRSIRRAHPRTPPPRTCCTRCATRSCPRSTRGTGVTVLVGGNTAIFDDFSHVLSRKLPLFIGVVVLLSFLLLMAVFRSILIPLTAAADEHALGRRGARHRHRGVPGRVRRVVARHQDRSDRGLPTGADLPDSVRPLDGLRGVPDQPRLRRVASAPRQS